MFVFPFFTESNDQWVSNQYKKIGLTVLVHFVSLVFGAFTFLYRPLNSKVSIFNSNDKDKDQKQTRLFIKDSKIDMQEYQRTFSCEIFLKKKQSLWWGPVIWLEKYNEITMQVLSRPDRISLQPVRQFLEPGVSRNVELGFSVDINKLILEFKEMPSEPSYHKNYYFFITNHPDIDFSINSTITIIADVKIKPSSAFSLAPILKWLLKKKVITHELRIQEVV